MGKKANRYLRFVILAFNRKSGDIVWERTAVEALPHEGVFKDGSWASASPVTDGDRLLAFFGSYGLYCCDLEGNVEKVGRGPNGWFVTVKKPNGHFRSYSEKKLVRF